MQSIFFHLSQDESKSVRVVDSRVLIAESAVTKIWTIEPNDSESLLRCLKGRCALALNMSDFEKLATQRASDQMVNAESNVLTFSAECFYFSTAVSVTQKSMLRSWEEQAAAAGVSLIESPSRVNFSSIIPLKFPGHCGFGFRPIVQIYSCTIPFALFRTFVELTVNNMYCICIMTPPLP